MTQGRAGEAGSRPPRPGRQGGGPAPPVPPEAPSDLPGEPCDKGRATRPGGQHGRPGTLHPRGPGRAGGAEQGLGARRWGSGGVKATWPGPAPASAVRNACSLLAARPGVGVGRHCATPVTGPSDRKGSGKRPQPPARAPARPPARAAPSAETPVGGGGCAGLAPHHPVLELPEVSGAQRAEAGWRAAHWAVPLAGRAGSGGLSIWKQSCSYVSWPGRARLRVRELHSEGHGLRGESSQQPKNPDSCPGLRPALGLLGSPAQPGAGSAAAAASRNSVHFSSPRGGWGWVWGTETPLQEQWGCLSWRPH